MQDSAPQITVEDLDYALPDELIAQRPPDERGASRLLVVEAEASEPRAIGRFDATFLGELRDDDLVVANDSRVLHARIPVERPTGGGGELLLLAPTDGQPEETSRSRWVAMARPARKFRVGMQVAPQRGAGSGAITCLERTGSQTWDVELPVGLDDVPAWLLEHGEVPLPPYVTERDQPDERYQTVHARVDGSVAAPTAGLHFDDAVWAAVRERAEVAHVTLHVGAGTFLPVSADTLGEHVMHHERYEVPAGTDAAVRAALADGRRVLAIGTTSTRVLESVYGPRRGALTGSTDLFITPGYGWGCVSGLLTNFHLPKSTLIALVMAFQGVEATRALYQRAIVEQLRFYSFGDAMLLNGPPRTTRWTGIARRSSFEV